ncbi:hypothetical protein [Sphingomonas sp.]|jgi:hypothetical protein|uniref:hypothetical protein n=1 Tax=Sphingomonas sp. TaxID=28214 RepID=UPI002ED7E9C4
MKHLLLIPLFTLPAAQAQQDPVDAVAHALARGFAGEQSGDAKAMLAAAGVLQSRGAKPAAGEADISVQWQTQARRRGAKFRPAAPYRGRAMGPAYRRGVLAAGESLSTEQVFLAGQKASVTLVPQPSRHLTIRILTPDRKNLCELTATAPRAACNWLPMFTTRVRIQVTNGSKQPAHYFLVSN